MTIRAADVHSLAEIVWSKVLSLSGPIVYPGWTDLLLDLSNQDDPGVGRVGLPSFADVQAAQRPIGDLYSEITRTSWESNRSASGIYQAAAALLKQQHEYLAGFEDKKPNPLCPPYAVAFSTSFDLELELALLRQGRPFSLVLPVHVLASSVPTAVFTIWCVLHIKPTGQPSDIQSILNPQDDQWQLQAGAKDWLWEGPIVVRLAGCPSIRLPNLRTNSKMRAQISSCLDRPFDQLVKSRRNRSAEWDESIDEARDAIESNLAMAHALITNEYDALLHNSIDQGGQEEPHRLLEDFALDQPRWSRFWLLLGVQIQDTAFRHRVASLISTLPARGKIFKAHDFPPRRFGLAVNLYSTELEQELMSWSGFDMVSARISDFLPDLTHYGDHLVVGARERRDAGARGDRVAGAKFEEQCHV